MNGYRSDHFAEGSGSAERRYTGSASETGNGTGRVEDPSESD